MAYAEDPVPYSCPFSPDKPDPPRYPGEVRAGPSPLGQMASWGSRFPTRDPASSRGGDVEDQGGGHAAAGAHGGDAGAAAAAAELVGEGEDHAGAGHRDRMAEAAAAAEDVHGVLVEAERAGGGDAHRGEGLVDLPQAD